MLSDSVGQVRKIQKSDLWSDLRDPPGSAISATNRSGAWIAFCFAGNPTVWSVRQAKLCKRKTACWGRRSLYAYSHRHAEPPDH